MSAAFDDIAAFVVEILQTHPRASQLAGVQSRADPLFVDFVADLRTQANLPVCADMTELIYDIVVRRLDVSAKQIGDGMSCRREQSVEAAPVTVNTSAEPALITPEASDLMTWRQTAVDFIEWGLSLIHI